MGENAAVVPWKPSDSGRTGGDARLFIEAVLWIARTGSPWRDLPASFGNWNSVFKRFRDWVKAGVFKRMFDAVNRAGFAGGSEP
jgi:transposase